MTSEIPGRQQALWSQTLQLRNIEKKNEGRIQQEIANNCPAPEITTSYGAEKYIPSEDPNQRRFPLCFGALETSRVVKQALLRQHAKKNRGFSALLDSGRVWIA
jgi:hypothetical protein